MWFSLSPVCGNTVAAVAFTVRASAGVSEFAPAELPDKVTTFESFAFAVLAITSAVSSAVAFS